MSIERTKSRGAFMTVAALFFLGVCAEGWAGDGIEPYVANPGYWQYKGEAVLLLGGSKDDSLFQVPDLEGYLDELAAADFNFVRNTMSSRQDFGFELYPFKRLEDGTYDLNQWNDAYWERFANFLRWTEERDIIVQIEVWDRFDYSQGNWEASPWRPVNNVNYTVADAGLKNNYPDHPHRDKQPFFHTIPGMPLYVPELDVVREHQERQVAKMLSISLAHDNVLYCMNNETSTPVEWGLHWMAFIREAAARLGKRVYVTDMFDDGYEPHRSEKVAFAYAHPELYDFIDLSQVNSRVFNEQHWNRIVYAVEKFEGERRPINHTKIYSDGETNWGSGTPVDGVERFWRNLIAGSAVCRFHRPYAGIGSNDVAKACVAAARRVESGVKLWEVLHRQDLLGDREEDEAYLAANPGEAYVLFFTDGGEVTLDLSGFSDGFSMEWISISTGVPEALVDIAGGANLSITAPGKGPWVAVITRR